MKLVTYRSKNSTQRLGFLNDSYIYDAEKTTKYLEGSGSVHVPAEMIDVLNMDGEGFQQMSKVYDLILKLRDNIQELLQKNICFPQDQTKILLPFTPRAIICTGNNYRDHLEEKEITDSTDQKGDDIEFFQKLSECVIGPYDPIAHMPELTEKLDYENELAVVIGREAWQVSEEAARECIFGYTVFNDVSARDRQQSAQGCQLLGLSKNFEGCGVMGPCIVTADDFDSPPKLQLITKVNGEVRQNTNTDHMINYPAFIISYFSKFFKLKPGYVLLTGTCGGTAWSTDPEIGGIPYERSDIVRGGYLKPGDKVSCSIEGIGEIRNLIV